MTADGKITAARLRPGDRVMLRAIGDGAAPSPTKRKEAFGATVISIELVKRGRSIGRSILFSSVSEQKPYWVRTSATQTFWRAP